MAKVIPNSSWQISMACGIYCFTLIMTYVSSTFYHGIQQPKLKGALRIVDHISIYFLIAGSYTPFIILFLQESWGWLLFAMLWSLVAIGIVFKLFYTHRFDLFSTIIYLIMGWMAMLWIKPIVTNSSPEALILLIICGLLYTGGVVFYLWHKLLYHHAIWHVFVLGGSICHYTALIISV
ncbi:UNVERIFIED_CONTAM: hypothetical protein GTU68_052794 [Idotea baltica]|nr:hypothetical protein [Idotea baltica]